MYKWQRIREARIKGMSVKKLAATFQVSKNTIRKYIRADEGPVMKARTFPSRVDPYREQVEEMLRKGFIGTRIYEELKRIGFEGSQSSVHRYLQKRRRLHPIAEVATTRFETEPGEQMQYDWKEWSLELEGKATKIYIHSLVLGWSRKKFYVASLSITTADIIRAIHEGIVFFGGICRDLVIDNPKQMVLLHRKDGVIRYNDHFLKFCGLFGIIPNPCQNYRAQTKGKVERPFLFLQEHFLRGLEVKAVSEFDTGLSAFTELVNGRYHSGIETTPDDRFLKEKSLLIPLPKIEPTAWIVREIRKVSRDGYLSLAGCFYPVAMRLCGRDVVIESVFGKTFRVLEGESVVSEFPRRNQGPVHIVHPEHVTLNTEIRESKRREHSARVLHFVTLFGEQGQRFLEGLKEEQRENAYHHLNEVLLLTQFYHSDDIIAVLVDCIEMGRFHKNTVKRLLTPKPLKCPSPSTGSPSLHASVPITRSLSVYKELAHV